MKCKEMLKKPVKNIAAVINLLITTPHKQHFQQSLSMDLYDVELRQYYMRCCK